MRFLPRLSFLALVAALALSGCDGLLDIEPRQSISDDRARSTPQNVRGALIGAYDRAGDPDLYGGELMMGSDLMALDTRRVIWTGTFADPRQFWNKTLLVNNGSVEDTWEDAYEVINIANNVLSALDVFEDADERSRIEGHARFLRGVMLFELVRKWAPAYTTSTPTSDLGVPIVLDPTEGVTEENNLARNTVAEVYTQVVQDLEAARDQLPNRDGILGDTYAASAFLARVHLSSGDYAAAAAEASRVISEGGYELAPTFADAFNQESGSPEYVFARAITTQNGTNSLNVFYGSEDNSGRGDIEMTDDYVALFEEGDSRAFFYDDDGGILRTGKWQGPTSQGIDIPIIRLAEMYLTRAEANLRAGTSIGATPLQDVNVIRTRAGLAPLAAVILDDVLRERRLELDFEGSLLHDLKRTGGTIRVTGVGVLPATDPRFVYPIPQREIDANPNMVQNSFYL